MVSRRQALRAGLARGTIDSKVRHGLWQQVHLGVYATFTGTVAWDRNLVTKAELKAAMAGRGRLRWRDQLDEVIGTVAGGSHFPLEYRYNHDVERAHGLPAATRQAKFVKPDGTRGFRDRCYEQYGLIVELDGAGYHPAGQRGQDQARDNEATATIGATLRYGWADVAATPCETAGQVYRALRRRGYQGAMRPCSPDCRAVLAVSPAVA